MKRILVVANRTLCEQHLLDELRHRRHEHEGAPVAFHLLVPATHPRGMWTDYDAEREAQARLEEMLDTLAVAGIGASGEIGDANPVFAVADVLRRQHVDEIIISTLPAGVSKWMGANVVRRVRNLTGLPVTHVMAEHVAVEA